MFKNFYLRQNYLQILLERTGLNVYYKFFYGLFEKKTKDSLVEKHQDKWNNFMEDGEALKLDLQLLNKTKNEYYVFSFEFCYFIISSFFFLGNLSKYFVKKF